MSRTQMIKAAKAEMAAWNRNGKMEPGLALAILFAFIHRLTTGETVEQTFFAKETQTDYEI